MIVLDTHAWVWWVNGTPILSRRAQRVLGEAIRAVLTLRPGAHVTAADILRHCRARLEDFMVPRHVEFVDRLPTTATGKVARRRLAGTPGERA